LSVLALIALAETAGSITVEIGNVRSDRGEVVVDICSKDRFLEDGCRYHGEAKARTGTTEVVIDGVPPGQYAAQAFHDENGDGEINRALFGIPKEGVGFSRDARIRLGPPKWKDAVFTHQARPEVIRFDFRYFMGPKGPSRTRK